MIAIPIPEKVREIIATVAGVDPASVALRPEASLEEIGINGMRRVRLLGRLAEDFNIVLDPITIFEANTVADVIAMVEAEAWKK
jgi:acyl carrier protein